MVCRNCGDDDSDDQTATIQGLCIDCWAAHRNAMNHPDAYVDPQTVADLKTMVRQVKEKFRRKD